MGLLIVNAAAAMFMAGIGWLVQIVAYPLFAKVGSDAFPAYHAGWSQRITPVVFPPMAADLATSALLVVDHPAAVGVALPIIGLCLSLTTWLSTALLQVPAHNRLSGGFDRSAHSRLVRSSWIRTAAWTGHGAAACWMLAVAA